MKNLIQLIKTLIKRDNKVTIKEKPTPKIYKKPYRRAWKYDGEKSNIATSFFFSHKPDDRFLLVEDTTPNYWSIHFCTSDQNSLNEEEKELLVDEISKNIPSGDFLSSHGYITRGGLAGLTRFSKHGFVNSRNVRLVKDKTTNQLISIPIYKKL